VADASHELRTPITSIRGYAELFRRGADRRPEDLATSMARIEAEADRMGVLVDDLLLLARLDQRRPRETEAVDLGEIARRAVQDAGAARPAAPISLRLPAEAVVVSGAADQLRRALDNLIANARDHTGPGTSVTVELRAAGDEACLVVRDDGPGMGPDDAARAFDRFWQGDATIEHPRPGTGLGLAIVAELVAAHHGRIVLDTAPGQGACFTIVLPCAIEARPQEAGARSG
jgi:two-component system OmpR family sensor kinase